LTDESNYQVERWDGHCHHITERLLELVCGPQEIIAFVASSHLLWYHFSLYSPLIILSKERVFIPSPYYLFQLSLLGLTFKIHTHIATS